MADRLEDVLGAELPATVAALPDDVRERLAGQVLAARARLEADGQAAVEKALTGVPRPVRGLVRRALT